MSVKNRLNNLHLKSSAVVLTSDWSLICYRKPIKSINHDNDDADDDNVDDDDDDDDEVAFNRSNSDQCQISLWHSNAVPVREVMRIKDIIKQYEFC